MPVLLLAGGSTCSGNEAKRAVFRALTTKSDAARNRRWRHSMDAGCQGQEGASVIRIFVASVVALLGLAATAQAQDYPNRVIKFMQGFPPGGNVDIIARLVGNEMSKSLGQPIVVEAKPGQAGALAAETVARSPADGYTLVVLPSTHPTQAAIAKNLRYRAVEDFDWVSTFTFYPFLIVVRKDSRFHTLQQLIDEARAKPGILTYGSAGVGSTLHMTVELLGNIAKVKFQHVPYRGEAPSITGLLTGDTDFVAATAGTIGDRIRSGELRGLAVSSRTRWPGLDMVPTVAEAGFPGFEVISWTGLAGPAGMPKPVLQRLNAEVWRAVAAPGVKSKLEAMGGAARATTPDEMRALVASQLATWTKLAREAHISLD
jgi:tripartite-type tricarboxylate transporter receptor subunit TctC